MCRVLRFMAFLRTGARHLAGSGFEVMGRDAQREDDRPKQGGDRQDEPAAVFDWLRSAAAPQEEQTRRREVSSAVKAAVKELKPKLRIAILLKYFEELSYEEMSIVLDCSMGTVASRLNRGHKELARRLAHLKT